MSFRFAKVKCEDCGEHFRVRYEVGMDVEKPVICKHCMYDVMIFRVRSQAK